MKTSGEDSVAETKTAFDLSAFFRHSVRSGGLAALILVLSGLCLCPLISVPSALAESLTEPKNGGLRQWSVQIDEVDSGDLSPDPSLGAAIHENLLGELGKTKKFKQVFRSDDGNGDNVPDLLILKTTVQGYAPDRKARRATLGDIGLLGVVPGLFQRFCGRTTVSGLTKLKVRIQLYTREGHLVLEDVLERNVQSRGNNMRSTQKLARNVAVILSQSTLPDLATKPLGQETAEDF